MAATKNLRLPESCRSLAGVVCIFCLRGGCICLLVSTVSTSTRPLAPPQQLSQHTTCDANTFPCTHTRLNAPHSIGDNTHKPTLPFSAHTPISMAAGWLSCVLGGLHTRGPRYVRILLPPRCRCAVKPAATLARVASCCRTFETFYPPHAHTGSKQQASMSAPQGATPFGGNWVFDDGGGGGGAGGVDDGPLERSASSDVQESPEGPPPPQNGERKGGD